MFVIKSVFYCCCSRVSNGTTLGGKKVIVFALSKTLDDWRQSTSTLHCYAMLLPPSFN